MNGLMNDPNDAVRKPVYDRSEDCGLPVSVFVEDPATHPMLLTQTMVRHISPATDQGTMPASGLQTVFSITHPDHPITQDGSGDNTILEMHTMI